jgi:pimeloyl-ACP methyl ester carboxylesterase
MGQVVVEVDLHQAAFRRWHTGVMAPWRRVVGSAVGAVDRAVVVAMQMRGARGRARADPMDHDERMELLAAIHRDYGGDELVSDPSSFFPTPPTIDPVLRPVRRGSPPRTEVFDAQWSSTFEPYLADVAPKYLAHVENRTARARLFFGELHAPRRPAVIAIHGYMGGQWMLEEAQWPVAWLTKRGLDVALQVLPFHALRGGRRRGAPPFPSADPRLTNEGFRQAVADIQGLARWLRQRGAPHVGVMGMSLGGYTSALLATVCADIDFAMPMIPLASIADFAREQGRLGQGDQADAQHQALERANWVVSPMARPLLLPKSRVLVVAAEHDRITPSNHARRIATHFGCEMVTIPGGHLVQLGRSEAFRGLALMLEREQIIARRVRR